MLDPTFAFPETLRLRGVREEATRCQPARGGRDVRRADRPDARPARGVRAWAGARGQAPRPLTGAVMEPIVLASTFAQPEPGKPLRFDYSPMGSPPRQIGTAQCYS